MSRDLFIDPGAKPAFAVVHNKVILNVTLEHPGGVFDRVVCENQYWAGKSKDGKNNVSPIGLMTLCQTAGWLLGQTNAKKYAFWAPADWKPVLFRNGNSIKKEVFCRRVYRRLCNERLQGIVDGYPSSKNNNRQQDALDAIGIALAFYKIDEDALDWRLPVGQGEV